MGDEGSNPIEQFWVSDYQKRFLQLMKTYEKNVFFKLGAHIHRGRILAPTSTHVQDLNLITILTPAISPIYLNNPSYTQLEIHWDDTKQKYQFDSVKFNSINLNYYQVFKHIEWVSLDIMYELGVNFNEVDSIRLMWQRMMRSPIMYTHYEANVIGQDWLSRQISMFFYAFFLMRGYGDHRYMQGTVCTSAFYEAGEAMKQCLESSDSYPDDYFNNL